MIKFKIDPEFKELLPKLSYEAYAGLRISLQSKGFTEPITLWFEKGILLDGHNRVEIARAERPMIDIPTAMVNYEKLASREEAIKWIIEHQLHRRNLSDEQLAYFRGGKYLDAKQPRGGPKGHDVPLVGSTAEKVGEQFGVDAKTIKRDAQYKQAVDAIAEQEGVEPEEIVKRAEPKKKVIEQIFVPKPKEPKPPKKIKPGNQLFDWDAFDRSFAVVGRGPDDVCRGYKLDKEDEDCLHYDLIKLLTEFGDLWKKWRLILTKEK